MNYNKAVILGRLTHDPEVKSLPSGQSVVSFSMATNRVWNDQSGNKQEATDFHNIVAFGKLADICGNYLNKGRLVLIEGRIQTRSWQGQDGTKKYRTEIVASNMQMGPRTDGAKREAPTQGRDPVSEDVGDIPIIEAEEPIKQEPVKEKPTKEEPIEENKEKVDLKNIPF